MWQLVVSFTLTFPGPVIEVDAHPVLMLTQNYRVAITGFPTQAACRAYKSSPSLQNFPLTLTNALGVVTNVVLDPSIGSCERES